MYIAKHGLMTLDAALRLSPVRRLAAVVTLGELDGLTFDWQQGRFKTPGP